MAPRPWTTKTSKPPGSSDADKKAEPDKYSRHRFGTYTGEDRVAGTTSSDEYIVDPNHIEVAESRKDISQVPEIRGKNGLFTVRDVIASQVDWKLQHPTKHPVNARYVLNVTEGEIKDQPEWPANVEKQKQQKQQAQEQDKSKDSGSDSGIGGSEGEGDAASTSEKDEESAKDQEYTRNRQQNKPDNRANPANPDHKNPDPNSSLSAQEQHFLENLRQEAEHLSSLQPNNGKGRSPLANYDHRVIDIDEKDQNTPDNWIPRSSDLIRLTGNSPLNAEPNLGKLFAAGLVTPNKLHYVRNHGAVPRLNYETHRLHVFTDCQDVQIKPDPEAIVNGEACGQETPGCRFLHMEEIDGLDWINIPVAVACDGNRRKELNMIKRSKGFDWGSGAISNAYWKGPLVSTVFAACGLKKEHVQQQAGNRRLFVHFEGADQLSEGKYATSVPFDHVFDPCNDVLLAQYMNDVPLHPDHGYPLRMVLPGFVGGRHIKWLEKMWISDKPSENHYYIWDNRVLPTFVTEKDGPFAETMFKHPDTACNEQNLNSAIAHPAQGEEIDLSTAEAVKPGKTYRIQGYAYEGGGHMVQKVEVSLDKGQSWIYAYRKFPENALRHGWKFWTWCHWYCDVELSALVRAQEIVVRAWNVFKNTQPEHPTWNLMGMMNNCWYRVKPEIQHVPVIPDENQSVKKTVLTFRHPCEPGGKGGWMKPSTEILLQEAKQQAASPGKEFTAAEIEKHRTEDDCWIVVNEKVYDATSVLDWHPGGAHVILGLAGKVTTETSEQYNSIHDDFATHKLSECAIGTLTKKAKKMMYEEMKARMREQRQMNKDPAVVLKKHQWTSVKLCNKEAVSKDSRRYTFCLPQKDQKLGLETGQHLLLGFHFADKMVFRAYTPTRPVMPSEEDGTFDLVIKTYFPSEKNPGGTISNILDSVEIGEFVDIRGPTGEIEYQGSGKFRIEGNETTFKTLNLIGGGSGVTPHYQLIHRILSTPGDKTKIVFVYANNSEPAILMRDELDALSKKYQDSFSLVEVLSHPSDDWSGEKGHVNEQILEKYCGKAGDGKGCFLCGPPPMIKAAHSALQNIGYKDDSDLFAF